MKPGESVKGRNRRVKERSCLMVFARAIHRTEGGREDANEEVNSTLLENNHVDQDRNFSRWRIIHCKSGVLRFKTSHTSCTLRMVFLFFPLSMSHPPHQDKSKHRHQTFACKQPDSLFRKQLPRHHSAPHPHPSTWEGVSILAGPRL